MIARLAVGLVAIMLASCGSEPEVSITLTSRDDPHFVVPMDGIYDAAWDIHPQPGTAGVTPPTCTDPLKVFRGSFAANMMPSEDGGEYVAISQRVAQPQGRTQVELRSGTWTAFHRAAFPYLTHGDYPCSWQMTLQFVGPLPTAPPPPKGPPAPSWTYPPVIVSSLPPYTAPPSPARHGP